MPSSNVCWGIELGAGAVKALKLVRDGDAVSVADFAVIPHKRPLSAPDVDEMDAMRVGIGQLVANHDLSRATIALSIPGHASFARFAKLPPVEPKKVPEIVKFEAAQQIPFSLDEVEWDYQTFVSEDSPDVEVGIFAVMRERIMEKLSLCADVKVRPDCIALSPVSVFNAVAYDLGLTDESPGTVILDVGTTAADLIVIEAGRVWIRTFPLGGHNFTEAIASSFKLPYPKAEKLKRDADKSKHKRHIFQAMRGTFADLGQDVQRSLQYYKQLHPDADLRQVIGVGSTFKLPGLRKILGQQLQMDVQRCEGFKKASVDGPKAADFQSSALTLMTCYGLALQGLGMATIDANLIPSAIVRESMWQRKTPWFAAAAGIAIAAGAASFVRPVLDQSLVTQAQAAPTSSAIQQAIRLGQQQKSEAEEVMSSTQIGAAAENVRSLTKRRDIYEYLVDDLGQMLATGGDPSEVVSSTSNAGSWGFFDLVRFDVEYQTPSGAVASGPEPGSRQQTPSGGDDFGGNSGGRGRPSESGSAGGRGRPGAAAASSNDRAGASRVRRGGGDDPGAAAAQIAPYGKMVVTLIVDSSHEDLSAYVDETILAWLNENAEREGVPYTLIAPSADSIFVEPLADGGRDKQDRSGDRDGGGETETSGRLSQIAPLPTLSRTFPEDATVYRYTITFEAPLTDGGAAGGQQAMPGGFE